MPHHMVRKTRTKYFNPNSGLLNWDSTAPEARYVNTHCKPLNEYANKASSPGSTDEAVASMLDLIARMLEYEPQHRSGLKEALRHAFFDRLAAYERSPEDLSRHVLRLQI